MLCFGASARYLARQGQQLRVSVAGSSSAQLSAASSCSSPVSYAARPVRRRSATIDSLLVPSVVLSGPSLAAPSWRQQRLGHRAFSTSSSARAQPGAPGAGQAEANFKGMTVVEATALNFDALIKHSMDVPIIIDVYADWCAPCKQLTPELVNRVQKAKGKILLAKVNADREEQIVAALKIQTLPTVLCIYQNKTLGGFAGAKSNDELDQFFTKILSSIGANSKEEDLLDEAQEAFEQGNIPAASQLLSNILADNESSHSAQVSAYALLIHCCLAERNMQNAKMLVDVLKTKYASALPEHPTAQQAISAVELAASTESAASVPLTELLDQVKANPKDANLRHQLAQGYLAQSKFEEGLEQLLEAIKCDRGHNEAKQLLFKSLETLGPDHPLTPTTRRRLGNILFT